MWHRPNKKKFLLPHLKANQTGCDTSAEVEVIPIPGQVPCVPWKLSIEKSTNHHGLVPLLPLHPSLAPWGHG